MSRKIVIHKRARTVAARPVAMVAPRVASPAQPTAPSAMGTIVGGWVVLLVACVAALISPALWLIVVPVFTLASVVMSIAGLVRGSLIGGIFLLLGCCSLPFLFAYMSVVFPFNL